MIEKTHEISDNLEKAAGQKKTQEITKVQAYYEGYIQACEDFGRAIRSEIY